MAIEHFLHIKGDKIRLSHFIKYCASRAINFEVVDDDRVYLVDSGMKVCFHQSKPPYNVWESNMFKMDFQYDWTISFRLGKNSERWEEQKNFVLGYTFELMQEIGQEGLFLYNSDLELCYFKENGSKIINDEFGVLEE